MQVGPAYAAGQHSQKNLSRPGRWLWNIVNPKEMAGRVLRRVQDGGLHLLSIERSGSHQVIWDRTRPSSLCLKSFLSDH